jgi:hypothetical protein
MRTKVVANIRLHAPWWRGFCAGHKVKWSVVKRRLMRQLREAVDESGVKVSFEMDTFTILDADSAYQMDFETDAGRPLSDKEVRDAGIRSPGSVRTRIGSCIRDLVRLPFIPR